MKKIPFLTLEKAKEIREQIPTPFYVYDEAGIRASAAFTDRLIEREITRDRRAHV